MFSLFFFLLQENGFSSFPHSRNLKVQIVVLEFQLNAIFIFFKFLFFPSRSGSQRLKKRVGDFLNSIGFNRYRTFLKLREKTCRVNARKWLSRKDVFRIIDFPNKFMLVINFSSI